MVFREIFLFPPRLTVVEPLRLVVIEEPWARGLMPSQKGFTQKLAVLFQRAVVLAKEGRTRASLGFKIFSPGMRNKSR